MESPVGLQSESPVALRSELPVGRRVLVAVVRGAPGERIQRWRERHDAKQSQRLPPHLTLCYRPPVDVPLHQLEAQVRHAFPEPVTVRLGGPKVLDHREQPLTVEVLDTETLDAARRRLFDRRFVEMGGRDEWPWHITSVRYGYRRDDLPALLDLAATDLQLDAPWTIDEISYLELRDGRYEPVAELRLA
jgi:hypothetical protein